MHEPTVRPRREAPAVVLRLVSLLSLVVVLALVPALPAAWRGLTHLGSIGDGGQGELGTVAVTGCSQGTAPRSWTCRGRFQVNDPMAEPYPSVDGVTVENDARSHPIGTRLDATKALDSTRVYRWGGARQLSTTLLWLGICACLAGAALAVRELRRGLGWLPVPVAVVGLLLLLGAKPLW